MTGRRNGGTPAAQWLLIGTSVVQWLLIGTSVYVKYVHYLQKKKKREKFTIFHKIFSCREFH